MRKGAWTFLGQLENRILLVYTKTHVPPPPPPSSDLLMQLLSQTVSARSSYLTLFGVYEKLENRIRPFDLSDLLRPPPELRGLCRKKCVFDSERPPQVVLTHGHRRAGKDQNFCS